MGNTQHSLLSGTFQKQQTDRGKSLSPFMGSRSLITSKSPLRNNEKALVTQNEWGGTSSTAKASRYGGELLLQNIAGGGKGVNNYHNFGEENFTVKQIQYQQMSGTPKSQIQNSSTPKSQNQLINLNNQKPNKSQFSANKSQFSENSFISNNKQKYQLQSVTVQNTDEYDITTKQVFNNNEEDEEDVDLFKSKSNVNQQIKNNQNEEDFELLLSKSQYGKSIAATGGLITPQNEPMLMQNSNMLKVIKQHSTASKTNINNHKVQSQSLLRQHNFNSTNKQHKSFNKLQSQSTFNQTAHLLKDKLKNSILVQNTTPMRKQEKHKRPNLLERKSPNNKLQEKSRLLSNERSKLAEKQVKEITSQISKQQEDSNSQQTSSKLKQVQNLQIHKSENIIKDFDIARTQSEVQTSSIKDQSMHPSTQRHAESKRFTFDSGEVMKSSSIGRKSHLQQRNNSGSIRDDDSINSRESPDDCDIHIKVYYDNQRFVTIKWSSHHNTLTCGWLISEIMRHLRFEDGFNKYQHIIGMKNMNQKASECYDYLLTQLESPLHFINDGDNLSIITLPEKFLVGSLASANSNFSPIFSDSHMPVINSSNPNQGVSSSNNQHLQLTLEDFELIKVIGKGGFSKVFQVRKKDTGKIYAMKTLSKAKIKRDNKVENILNERAILEQVSHPFIIQMKYAFQNEDYLFLILEFCAGGELFYRLSNIPQGRMTEKQAKFYFAEILEAIQYLHDNNILYRDLKPENIVIDESGHVKLTDFGLSKLGFHMGDRAYSFCGSPEYMAPEMLLTEKNRQMGLQPLYHDKALDFYHLGALLHEMLCGLPPFFSEDRQKMYQDIIGSPIQFPSFLSSECQNLLHRLLQKDPRKRLGSQRGAAEIKEHPWCADIDWNLVFKKECNPPFKPFFTRSNFDPEYTSMNPILEDEDVLVSLDEQAKMTKTGEFLNEYENRIAKQKISKQNSSQINDNINEETRKLIRQHSIELYERENKTFRGYSFLQDPTNNPYYNQQAPFGYQDHEGFYFCLAESKDQSFTVGSPIQEFECLSDGEIVTLNNRPSQLQPSNPMNIDQEMITFLQKESQNQQSQQSLLSEGIEMMKANINQIQQKRKVGDKTHGQTKVQLQQNYLSKEGQKIIKNQQSKESLYNELLSTFDYSMSKKDKHQQDHIKKNINNTLSTMSLFSNSQQNQMGSYLFSQGGGDRTHQSREHRQKHDKNLSNHSLKEKLEFQKITRKYSPEVDLQRALVQTKQKLPSDLVQSTKKQSQNSIATKKNQQLSMTNQNISASSNHKESQPYLRTNSSNNAKSNIANGEKKQQVLLNSEYNTFGNPKQSNKIGTKKRASETNSNRATSPIDKSIIKSQQYKKPSNSKNHYSSVLKPSQQNLEKSSTINLNATSNQSICIQSNLKTTQLYNHVKTKINVKTSRQQTVPQTFSHDTTTKNQNKAQITKNNQHLEIYNEEESKQDQSFQILQDQGVNLNTNPSEKFIVQQITANELLGSFLGQQSNTSLHNVNNANAIKTDILINTAAAQDDQTFLDCMGNSSLGSLGNERSFEEMTNEVAATALLLNQSNESCCCSDDEFNQKYNTTRIQLTESPKTSQKQVSSGTKNVRRLYYNALQESINANQIKHQANNQQFSQQLEKKQTNVTSGRRKFEDKDYKNRVLSDLQLTTPIPVNEQRLSHDGQNMNESRSINQSFIDLNLAKKQQQQSLAATQQLKIEMKSPSNNVMNQRYNQAQLIQSKVLSPHSNLQSINFLNKTTPISPLRDSRQPISNQNSKLKERPSQKHEPIQTQSSVLSANNAQQINQSQNSQLNLPLSSQISVFSTTPRDSARQSKAILTTLNTGLSSLNANNNNVGQKNSQTQRQITNNHNSTLNQTTAHKIQKK